MSILTREQLNYVYSMVQQGMDPESIMEYLMFVALDKTDLTSDEEDAFRSGYQVCCELTRFIVSKIRRRDGDE